MACNEKELEDNTAHVQAPEEVDPENNRGYQNYGKEFEPPNPVHMTFKRTGALKYSAIEVCKL
ncbi:MAG: hypothetical protein ACLFTQ_01980 [Candidatus Aenigmatarchaeota archaeon]